MNKLPSSQRYSQVTQIFHWATAILVLVAFIYGLGGPEQRVYAVLAVTVLRLLWRLFDTRPAPQSMASWMVISSKLVQAGLYLLLFAVPLTAIAGAWLEGHPLTLLAGLQVAPQIAESHDLGVTISELHTWLGDAILWLAGLHAVAALYHHFFLKDGVLKSMLPG